MQFCTFMLKSMRERLLQIISQPRFLYGLYALLAVVASVQALLGAPKVYHEGGTGYLRYNNYVIFKQSFWHLIGQQDLYVHYPAEHWDLYKYTPTFAALFGALAIWPDWVGVHMWSLLNALLFAYAIYRLRVLDDRAKGDILVICAIEMMTSLQNGQSNGLMAALLLLVYDGLERQKTHWAALCLTGSIYLKLFGVVAALLGLLWPRKWALAGYLVVWMVVLALIPLVFVSVEQYVFTLKSYSRLLADDHTASYGYSVMGWLHSWFGWAPPKISVVAAGGLLLLLPYIRVKAWGDTQFRLLAMASILLWVVIFNHKAESPTFIIAVAGVAIWYVTLPQPNLIERLLLGATIIFTVLSPTDLFPRVLRETIVQPYVLKAVPCIAVWLMVVYRQLTMDVAPAR
jgi:Glycosyltransferase family 87